MFCTQIPNCEMKDNHPMKLFFVSLAALLLSACAPVQSKSVSDKPVANTVTLTPTLPAIQPAVVQAVLKESITPVLTLQPPPPSALNSREVECMAQAMYHEARGEGDVGMIGVGYTVVNRMKDSKFPDTACGVVYQGKRNKAGRLLPRQCQFNWACDSKTDKPKDLATYQRSTELAKLVLLGYAPNPIGKLKYFREAKLKSHPKQRYAYQKRLGNHLFYALASR
jgi:spore germination cell wall hydrolase CwlJ-like protein